MSIYVNVGGAAQLSSLYNNISSSQKSTSTSYANIDGAQKEIFSSFTTTTLSSCSIDDSVYINDSEGLSEYIIETTFKDSTTSCSLLRRVNVLNYNIISSLKSYIRSSGVYNEINTQSRYYYHCKMLSNISYVNTYINSLPSTKIKMGIPQTSGSSYAGASYISLGNFNISYYDRSTQKDKLAYATTLNSGGTTKNGTKVIIWDGSFSSYNYGFDYYYSTSYAFYEYDGTSIQSQAYFEDGNTSASIYNFPNSAYIAPLIGLPNSTTVYVKTK